MKEKEDKIRLMKQILVDEDDTDPAMTIPQKERIPESAVKVFSDTETRTSRKVVFHSIKLFLKISD